jgi:hypothetical protein
LILRRLTRLNLRSEGREVQGLRFPLLHRSALLVCAQGTSAMEGSRLA